jgi:putative flippase GtrA
MTTTSRWVRFTLVGLAGFALQLTAVWLLARLTPLPVSVIVTLAVVLTVSHNFFWHERVTWPGHTREGRRRRWLAFLATNGLISIATNVVVTGPIMQVTGLPIQAANAIAVVAASCANFVAGDKIVFASGYRIVPRSRIRVVAMRLAAFAAHARRREPRRIPAEPLLNRPA